MSTGFIIAKITIRSMCPFAKELEEAGKIESARHLKDMISLTTRSTECLRKAMKALG